VLPSQPLVEVLTTQEKAMIETALAETRGQVSGATGAAAKLSMRPSTLESKIKSLKINKHASKNHSSYRCFFCEFPRIGNRELFSQCREGFRRNRELGRAIRVSAQPRCSLSRMAMVNQGMVPPKPLVLRSWPFQPQ
jgi:hypothetical protein